MTNFNKSLKNIIALYWYSWTCIEKKRLDMVTLETLTLCTTTLLSFMSPVVHFLPTTLLSFMSSSSTFSELWLAVFAGLERLIWEFSFRPIYRLIPAPEPALSSLNHRSILSIPCTFSTWIYSYSYIVGYFEFRPPFVEPRLPGIHNLWKPTN